MILGMIGSPVAKRIKRIKTTEKDKEPEKIIVAMHNMKSFGLQVPLKHSGKR